MEEKKEIQLDNVMAYEAGKRDAIAEVLEFVEQWNKADPEASFHPNLSSWRLYDALLQKFGGKE